MRSIGHPREELREKVIKWQLVKDTKIGMSYEFHIDERG